MLFDKCSKLFVYIHKCVNDTYCFLARIDQCMLSPSLSLCLVLRFMSRTWCLAFMFALTSTYIALARKHMLTTRPSSVLLQLSNIAEHRAHTHTQTQPHTFQPIKLDSQKWLQQQHPNVYPKAPNQPVLHSIPSQHIWRCSPSSSYYYALPPWRATLRRRRRLIPSSYDPAHTHTH